MHKRSPSLFASIQHLSLYAKHYNRLQSPRLLQSMHIRNDPSFFLTNKTRAPQELIDKAFVLQVQHQNIPNNQNGWIEEDAEEEEEDPEEDLEEDPEEEPEDDDDMEMDDEVEVIDPYMDDGSNNPPPPNSEDEET
nr:hypothetical protein [Tanacetum cinerariifolium]